MKIITFSVIRNESDIIEAFVRHHTAFVERMVIVDHRSRDNSWEILKSLKAEGLPIDIRRFTDFTYDQSRIFMETVREISKSESPDWMIALDADEFLIAVGGRDINSILETETQKKVLKIPWRCYVPRPEDDVNEKNVLKRIAHRRTKEDPQWWKIALPGRILKEVADIWLGTHDAYSHGQPLSAETSRNLALAHFPVRSAEQLSFKAVVGWIATRHFYWKHGTVNGHWKYIYDLLTEKGLFTPDDLKKIALEYVSERQWELLPEEFTKGKTLREIYPAPEGFSTGVDGEIIFDPVPFYGEIRYPVSPADFQKMLLESARDLAEEFGRYKAETEKTTKS